MPRGIYARTESHKRHVSDSLKKFWHAKKVRAKILGELVE